MKSLSRYLLSFHSDESATTAVEYAIMLAVILIACIAAILNTGDVQGELWNETSSSFEQVMPDGPQL